MREVPLQAADGHCLVILHGVVAPRKISTVTWLLQASMQYCCRQAAFDRNPSKPPVHAETLSSIDRLHVFDPTEHRLGHELVEEVVANFVVLGKIRPSRLAAPLAIEKNNFLLYLHVLGWSMLLDLDWRSRKLSASA
jgi:hypothetical protein